LSIFSFSQSPTAEILHLAPAIHQDGTPQSESDLIASTTVLSIANPYPALRPTSEQTPAQFLNITAPSPSSPGYLLSFEEESPEETARKREAALRMLEGEIPAVATGAYVRI